MLYIIIKKVGLSILLSNCCIVVFLNPCIYFKKDNFECRVIFTDNITKIIIKNEFHTLVHHVHSKYSIMTKNNTMMHAYDISKSCLMFTDVYLIGGDCQHSAACSHCADSQITHINLGGLTIQFFCHTCGKSNSTLHIGYPHSAIECDCL